MRRIAAAIATAAIFVAGCNSAKDEPRLSEPTTTTSAVTDGRLHARFEPKPFDAASASLDNWRIDPAPVEQQPTATSAQVQSALAQQDYFRSWIDDGKTPRIWFGLFYGNAPNPDAPDGHLTGSHPIGPVPAWLVVVDGTSGSGSMSNEVGPTHLVAVVYDTTDAPVITGVEESGGDAPPIY